MVAQLAMLLQTFPGRGCSRPARRPRGCLGAHLVPGPARGRLREAARELGALRQVQERPRRRISWYS